MDVVVERLNERAKHIEIGTEVRLLNQEGQVVCTAKVVYFGRVDKNKHPLKVGDNVAVLRVGGSIQFLGKVGGFEPNPEYDPSCIGVHVAGVVGSFHPSLIEKYINAEDKPRTRKGVIARI